MKKWTVLLTVLAAVILIAVAVYLAISFSALYRQPEPTQSSSEPLSVEAYAQTNLKDYAYTYDPSTHTLTLSRASSLSYEDARSFGANVYADELAPETYCNQVYSIALDILAKCQLEDLSVTLQYTATGGETIFSVSSDGTVWTCWEAP